MSQEEATPPDTDPVAASEEAGAEVVPEEPVPEEPVDVGPDLRLKVATIQAGLSDVSLLGTSKRVAYTRINLSVHPRFELFIWWRFSWFHVNIIASVFCCRARSSSP